MFDRESELRHLKKAISANRAEMIVIYGRRGLGKTTLVLKALEDPRSVYLFTPRGTIYDVLRAYEDNIREYLKKTVHFYSWRDFLEFIKELGEKGFTVAIDEFQRLSEAFAPAISLLQDWWDRKLKNTQIKLILIGSLIGMVERLVLSGDAPLFGRRTLEMKIRPISFIDMYYYWRNYNLEDRVAAYGVFGGTPNYFSAADRNSSLKENIEALILDRNGRLTREPENLLNEETRAAGTYLSILSLLTRSGRGAPLSKIHVKRGSPNVYLNTLMKMDLVERVDSLSGAGTLYRISDEFFRFWFYFIYPKIGIIECGRGHSLLHAIEEDLPFYLSLTFEKILFEIILAASNKNLKHLRIPLIEKIGGYWRKDIELDIVAIGEHTLIAGEAKWHEKPIGKSEVEHFLVKAGYVAKTLKLKRYIGVILSKKGFTTMARQYEGENLVLLSIEEFDNIFRELKYTRSILESEGSQS